MSVPSPGTIKNPLVSWSYSQKSIHWLNFFVAFISRGKAGVRFKPRLSVNCPFTI